ncbi:hypothetical protein D3C76_1185990 [compost metagenome]
MRVAASAQQLLVDIRHHRLVQVQRPTALVHGQGVDPRNTLQLLDRAFQRRQAVGTVDLVPLLQHPGVVQVGVTQAVGRVRIPVQAPGPLHHRAELRAVDLPLHLAEAAILGLDGDADGLPGQWQRLAIQQVTGRVLGV